MSELILKNKNNELVKSLPLLLLILALPVFLLVLSDKTKYIIFYLSGISVFLMVLYPRFCFWMFLISISLYFPTYFGKFALHPFDLAFAVFFGAYLLNYFLRGKTKINLTGLDIPFLILILATIVSSVFAFNISYSIVPCFRMILIYLSFRLSYDFSFKIGFKKIISFYIYHVFVLSLINIVLFIIEGGTTRVFGPAWLTFEAYSMTSIPISLAFLIWAESRFDKFKFGLIAFTIFIALLATQSRAPLLAIVLSIPILYYQSYKKMKLEQSRTFRKNILKTVYVFVSVIILMVLFKDSVFEMVYVRIEHLFKSLENPQGTVYLRLVLWTAALKAFAQYPFTGIGIGNFKIIGQIIPEMKYYPVWYYISGMSAHNVFLHYLAETGLIGTASLVSIVLINLKKAFQTLKMSITPTENSVSFSVFIAIVVFSITVLYMRAWTWGQDGYIMALLFALNMGWNKHLKSKTSDTDLIGTD